MHWILNLIKAAREWVFKHKKLSEPRRVVEATVHSLLEMYVAGDGLITTFHAVYTQQNRVPYLLSGIHPFADKLGILGSESYLRWACYNFLSAGTKSQAVAIGT